MVRNPNFNGISSTSHHTTLDRDMIFNLSTVVNWRSITLRKQKQVDQDNLGENARRITNDYAEQDKVYVTPNGINRKLDYCKKGLYTITQIYTNGTTQIQQGSVNARINIRRLEPYFKE